MNEIKEVVVSKKLIIENLEVERYPEYRMGNAQKNVNEVVIITSMYGGRPLFGVLTEIFEDKKGMVLFQGGYHAEIYELKNLYVLTDENS